MDKFSKTLSMVTDNTGVATQIFPPWMAAGANPGTATVGQLLREPCEGQLINISVNSDLVHAGELELWDISGIELGVDVSSVEPPVITATVLNAAVAAGKAKLLLKQQFAASNLTPWAPAGPTRIMKGLAARVIGAAGSANINFTTDGCYRYTERG